MVTPNEKQRPRLRDNGRMGEANEMSKQSAGMLLGIASLLAMGTSPRELGIATKGESKHPSKKTKSKRNMAKASRKRNRK